MTDEPLCSCGTELRVMRGGFLRCTHCDQPHPLKHCKECIRYAKNLERRYPERSGS